MAVSTHDTTQNSGLAIGFVGAVIGASMLVYAALYIEQAWRFVEVEQRYREIERGKPATVVELDALAQALRASPMPSDFSRAAFVQMLAAQQLGIGSVRAVSRLAAARRDLRRGLSGSPADAYAWMRLAVTEVHLHSPKAAAKALKMALMVAPRERKLAALQFDLAIVLWPELDGPGKEMIERRLNWVQTRAEMRRVVEGNSAKAIRQRLKDERAQPPQNQKPR